MSPPRLCSPPASTYNYHNYVKSLVECVMASMYSWTKPHCHNNLQNSFDTTHNSQIFMKECVSVYYAVEEVLFQVATLPQVPHHTPCKKTKQKQTIII